MSNPTAKYPPGIPYIIGNEGCERFSYYGMRAVLWTHMVSMLTPMLGDEVAKNTATSRMHLFFAGVYAFPLVGAIIADRLLGKYRTIFWLSLVYCVGQGALAFWGQTEAGLGVGLLLVAVGTGGIKPCVSAQVGDQFDATNAHLLSRIYQAFYFIINFGSFFATLLTPWLYKSYGPGVAFAVPGVLMAISTWVLWLGRNRFVKLPPSPGGRLGVLDAVSSIALFSVPGSLFFTAHETLGVQLAVSGAAFALWLVLFNLRQRLQADAGFLSVLLYAVKHRRPGRAFFASVKERFGDEAAEGPPAVFRILSVFALVSVFWSLFDQKASSFVNQAVQLDRDLVLPVVGAVHLEAPQLSALNPFFVMLIIPLLNAFVYPVIERFVRLTPLRKMSAGMFLGAAAFATVAMLQGAIESAALAGTKVSVAWQVIPYVLLTTAEVLVSATGLEFAYTQAPRSMKSTVSGFWLLTTTIGNLLVAALAGLKSLDLQTFFWVFTGLMLGAAFMFSLVAVFYKGRTYIQSAS